MVARAGTLLIPSGPAHDPDRHHLHVVCTDPCNDGKQLIVGINSWINDQCDAACILQAHEHQWLNRVSYVFYRKARIVDAIDLDNGVVQGVFTAHPAMNGQTFLRIRNGICLSAQTSLKIKAYYGCVPPAPVVVANAPQ